MITSFRICQREELRFGEAAPATRPRLLAKEWRPGQFIAPLAKYFQVTNRGLLWRIPNDQEKDHTCLSAGADWRNGCSDGTPRPRPMRAAKIAGESRARRHQP